MNRLGLYVAGVSAVVAAWMMFRNRMSLPDRLTSGPNRRVPVKKAAEMLQHAWADHHTVA
jgi:hypothetical protein